MSAVAVTVPDSLPDLAAAINAAHQGAVGRAKEAIDRARECGLYLIAAKRLVDHVEWLSWLKANTTVSERQSQKYMRRARRPKTNLGSHSINAPLKALSDHRRAAVYVTGQPGLPLGDQAPDERPLGWIIRPSDSWNFSRTHYAALTHEDTRLSARRKSWPTASGTTPSLARSSWTRWRAQECFGTSTRTAGCGCPSPRTSISACSTWASRPLRSADQTTRSSFRLPDDQRRIHLARSAVFRACRGLLN
jgi:Protein of unknown function (DUF3102)